MARSAIHSRALADIIPGGFRRSTNQLRFRATKLVTDLLFYGLKDGKAISHMGVVVPDMLSRARDRVNWGNNTLKWSTFDRKAYQLDACRKNRNDRIFSIPHRPHDLALAVAVSSKISLFGSNPHFDFIQLRPRANPESLAPHKKKRTIPILEFRSRLYLVSFFSFSFFSTQAFNSATFALVPERVVVHLCFLIPPSS